MAHRSIIAAAITALTLAACGSASAQPGAGSSGTTETSALATGNPATTITLHEAGSTLLLPLLQDMVSPLHEDYPNIVLAPAGGGSGKGIDGALSGSLDLGGSDAYLSNIQAQQHPDIFDVPIAVSAQALDYNLPGITDLKLTGEVVAQIYEGHITTWNAAAIASLNPGAQLPATRIVPVRRSDASGDTFIFTQFLTDASESWRVGPSFGTTVPWPAVSAEITAPSNSRMVPTCAATPGCVAYVGVSARQAAADAGLGEAFLQNRAGAFLRPTADTITAVVSASMRTVPGDLRRSLIYFDGPSSYPIINFEYVMLNRRQPSAAQALAVRTFLAWAVDPAKGNSPEYLSKVDFVPLPSIVRPGLQALIASVGT